MHFLEPILALASHFSRHRPTRTHVRVHSVREPAYLTNRCSLHREPQPSRGARFMRSVSPARSSCSRTTTPSTGRSTGTSPTVRPIRIERRCAGVSFRGVQDSRRRQRTSAFHRSRRRPCSERQRRRAARRRPVYEKTGGVLLSQALASQVPSALRGLTALFGMGRGVSPSPRPPEKDERPRLPGPSKLHSATTSITPLYEDQKNPSSPRPISTGLLRTLPSFQIRPINLVVYQGSYSL